MAFLSPRNNLCLRLVLVILMWTDAAPVLLAAKLSKGSSGQSDSSLDIGDVITANIEKSTQQTEELINKHMANVDKDPGALVTKETMQEFMQGGAFLPRRTGSRSILLESQQGTNGVSNFQPASWKITETIGGETIKQVEPAAEKQPVATYPSGQGPVLLDGCEATGYDKSSPCYKKVLLDVNNTVCVNMMDAANYLGIGFDGRGYYRSESRKSSLIQRSCSKGATFNGMNVPDIMNVLGIFDTSAETKSFQSVDDYMKFIRNKAGVSNQKNVFSQEANKMSSATSSGGNLGVMYTAFGALLGAVAGGQAAAATGAEIFGSVGRSIRGGYASGSGNQKSTDQGERSLSTTRTDSGKTEKRKNQSFFAIMYVNVILYEITLDEVKTTNLNFATLKDYMSLPVSYFSARADIKYQNFLLRWGTHFIRSAKFGGQLKITKTSKLDRFTSVQEFASFAETEFQAMFATLQSSYSQKSGEFRLFGIGSDFKKSSQKSSGKTEQTSSTTANQKNENTQSFRQSEFTQTSVEAQGGTSAIAEALVDFYTPAFKQIFHKWLGSIKDYPKPFEFQLKPINEFFSFNMDDLFPPGNQSYRCVGDGSEKYKTLVDPISKKRYYIDTQTSNNTGVIVKKKVKVYCKYKNIDDFKLDLQKRVLSLEKAVAVYMAEGPISASYFDLQGGQPGCEEATIAQVKFSEKNNSTPLTYAEMLNKPFLIEFDLPKAVPNIITTKAKYKMVHQSKRWFAVEPDEELMHLYEGCAIKNSKPTDTKLCFRNIILTYDESTGFFDIKMADFFKSKQRIPTLPQWLAGTTVASSRRITIGSESKVRPAIPCNVKWTNTHRLDPSTNESCVHFTAAGDNDLFVIFAAVPGDHTTWYYLQITPSFVSFYYAMKLEKIDRRKGIGMLGRMDLYQSFFVCVIQKSESLTIQYGKSDSDSEVGQVHTSYKFPPVSQFTKVSFYAFGAGVKPVSLMDVRLTRQLPEVSCLDSDYEKKDGHCFLTCHAECNGCRQPRDNTACHQCKNLGFQIGSGKDKQTTCVAECPPGMHLSESKKKLCVPCSAGFFKAAAGNHTCLPCLKGTSPEGASKCGKCPAGTISVPGRYICNPCPSGTFAPTGSLKCLSCPHGKFSLAGQAECSLCNKGYFNKKTRASSCQPCAAGTFTNEIGTIECTKCPVGQYSTSGQTKCSECSKGFFSKTIGSRSCEPCLAGTFTNKTGTSVCTECPAGQYSTAGQSKCQPCPNGYASGKAKCIRCPVNTYSRSGDAKCRDCPSNGVGKDGKACYPTLLRLGSCWGEAVSNIHSCENVIQASKEYNPDLKPFVGKADKDEVSLVTFKFSEPSTLRRVFLKYDYMSNYRIKLIAEGYKGQNKANRFTLYCGKTTSKNAGSMYFIFKCDSGEDGYVEKLIFRQKWSLNIRLIKAYTD